MLSHSPLYPAANQESADPGLCLQELDLSPSHGQFRGGGAERGMKDIIWHQAKPLLMQTWGLF